MALDHLVIACDTLDQGVRWCEETLGVTPETGGTHPKDGSHNRLLSLSGKYPNAYMEIIALDPNATPGRKPNFDLTDPDIIDRTKKNPILVAWVARPAVDIHETAESLRHMDPKVEVGEVLDTERDALKWKLTWRSDGRRLFDDLFPRLIQWPPSTPHPADTLPRSNIELVHISGRHPDGRLVEALQCAGFDKVLPVEVGAPDLVAILSTPKGTVELHSAVL